MTGCLAAIQSYSECMIQIQSSNGCPLGLKSHDCFGHSATRPHVWPYAACHGHMTFYSNFAENHTHNELWAHLTTVVFAPQALCSFNDCQKKGCKIGLIND